MNQQFNTRIRISLDWSEMDLFGHINNVAYFKYIQSARVNYCELAGINTADINDPLSFALASSTCQFRNPLFYPSDVHVCTKAGWIKNTSIQLLHVILNSKGDVAAEGEDVIVLFDYKNNCKREIPEAVRSAIENIEKKSS